MRLTTLEIKGFKSFADKVTIHFDNGVTSIVGPNGSGKSNVVDAMRWVLGEQKTRMLRSEKMENIIFNGTKTRKPANLAEVSLTFENTKNILPTEYSNVTITRRLYRSGDSEYLLNNVGCRLKDITDLFLDTGIGPDSYAIIELKMVDEILNDKNNSIKLLFEEAAGISKYKIRKKQTYARLEETEADLQRVNDLLFEIERNMKTLESQAKKTERYYKIKENYKELSTELALFTIAGSKQTFDDLQAQEDRQQEETIKHEAQIGESEAELQKEKLHTLDREKELSEAQKVLNEKMNFIRAQENEKKVSNERMKHLQDKEQSLTFSLANDKTTLLTTQEEIQKLETEKFDEENLLTQLNAQLGELKNILEATRSTHDVMKSDINRISSESKNIQQAMHESEKSFAVTQAKKDSLLKETERLAADSLLKQIEHDALIEQADEAQKLKEQKEYEYTALIETEEQLAESIILLDAELEKKTEEVIDESRKLDAKENEYKLMRSLVDNLEGYPESLKFLKKNSDATNKAPLVSDIISVKADFKAAVENFLEPYMNYFVIENVDEASKAVNLLSEASKGRANFFILKNFGDATAVHTMEVPDCISALDIIEVEEKYLPLCNYLLRNVYVVTENQDSTPFIQNGNQSLIFISQNGKFCKTRHALSGGSVGLFDGKRIGRGKQLDALSKEINELTVALRKTKTTRDALQEELQDAKQRREKFTSEKNVLQQESNKASQEYSSLRNKAEHVFSTIENNKKIADNLREQLLSVDGSLEESSANYEEHLQLLKTQFATITAQLTDLQLQFNDTVELLNKQSAGYNEHNIRCIQQQNKIANVVRDLAYKVTLNETLTKNIFANTIEFENIQQQINELVKTSADFDTQLVLLYGEKELMEQSVSVVEQAYFTARGTIDELENKLRTLRFEKEQANQLMNAIKEKTNELKLQLNSLQERLSVEFNIVLSEILDREPSPDWTEELLREKVNKIKLQIENYGPINPMAVEAFNEINERYTFITAQKEDLAKAKESLLQTMSEIEITARENFMTAFTQIRENFINVFRSLFTDDDKCDLILMDPANPTESDIQIIAQPKGKRPLSIQQLSGGEKTLTATALLFSIYLLKPAPFCIFDEVDAPLDDNNIDKFNNIIKKFSAESQFIIITHNKRTMTATNIIYGITMVEQGVTQLVPVDLGALVEAV